MNKHALKKFAVNARAQLIEAVRQRAYIFGITETVLPDISDDSQLSELVGAIRSKGYLAVMEEAAYTWFNRFIALRFMEVNGYLPSKIRVFSDDSGAFKPEILREALTVDIDGIDRQQVLNFLDLQDNEGLFKYLIITQCNALNAGLTEIFEKVGYAELLFPDNLLRSGSVLDHLVSDIPEDDWLDQVQLIGWLYQYYNTELKDETFALLKRNVKITKERIPAATQLFTPDWIVRYLVDNSLGELTDIAPTELTFIDPCMGSGHILVYAFDVLMQIYTANGWSERDAAVSILEQNLYGLDLDKRAYQLAYFALMMKARKYDRRILSRGIIPNLSHFQDIDAEKYPEFANADIFGSLLEIEPNYEPEALGDRMNKLRRMLTRKYDVVCTNPPYMGEIKMSSELSRFLAERYPTGRSDLFAAMLERCRRMCRKDRFYALITMQSIMYLKSFSQLRRSMIGEDSIVELLHLGANAFDSCDVGTIVQTAAFVVKRGSPDLVGRYLDLTEPSTVADKENAFLTAPPSVYFCRKMADFSCIDGIPFSYHISDRMLTIFRESTRLINHAKPMQGMSTADNDRFVRKWFEVELGQISFDSDRSRKWFPYNNGGGFRKWFGANTDIVNYENDGEELRSFERAFIRNSAHYFKPGITWNSISTMISARYFGAGCIFSNAGMVISADGDRLLHFLGLINSRVSDHVLDLLCPTYNFNAGDLGSIPIIADNSQDERIEELVSENIDLSRADWDSFEISRDFKKHPLT